MPADLAALIDGLVRDVPDFPTEGIMFKDVMPLLADPVAFRETIDRLAAWAGPRAPDVILHNGRQSGRVQAVENLSEEHDIC